MANGSAKSFLAWFRIFQGSRPQLQNTAQVVPMGSRLTAHLARRLSRRYTMRQVKLRFFCCDLGAAVMNLGGDGNRGVPLGLVNQIWVGRVHVDVSSFKYHLLIE